PPLRPSCSVCFPGGDARRARSGGQDERVAVTPRTVARIGGVDVRVDTSWFVIVALVTASLWDQFGANHDPVTALAMAGFAADQAGTPAVGEVAATMAWLNLVLAFFNLLPGAPLDGGRILDSIVWRVTGDHERARLVSTAAGRILGYGLIGLGVAWSLFVGEL